MKTQFTDLGIYGQKALRHLSEHCPKKLADLRQSGEIENYLTHIDEIVSGKIQILYGLFQRQNILQESATYLEGERQNNWLMRTATHLVEKDLIYLVSEDDAGDEEVDEMDMWNAMLPELDG